MFTITNTGADGLSYTVEEADACSWLSLDKTGGGPLVYNETDEVTATIDPEGLSAGTHACDVQFTNNCTPADVQTRTVTLVVLPSATAGAIAHYKMDDADPISLLMDSVAGYNAIVDSSDSVTTFGGRGGSRAYVHKDM